VATFLLPKAAVKDSGSFSKSLSEKGARLCRRPAAGRCVELVGLEIWNPLRLVEDDTAALRVFRTLDSRPVPVSGGGR
jgi:hypothetical protein